MASQLVLLWYCKESVVYDSYYILIWFMSSIAWNQYKFKYYIILKVFDPSLHQQHLICVRSNCSCIIWFAFLCSMVQYYHQVVLSLYRYECAWIISKKNVLFIRSNFEPWMNCFIMKIILKGKFYLYPLHDPDFSLKASSYLLIWILTHLQ